jgi:lysophospholipid acyltransferase (LPLAT)-like uncharacterized protein
LRIRSSLLTRLVAIAAVTIMRLWMGTLRIRLRYADLSVEPLHARDARRFIYAVWHETLLMPFYTHGDKGMNMLISRHQDGEYLAQTARLLRVGLVRGSTARGGRAALRQLVAAAAARTFHLAVTPDGPRGPRRRVQPGVLYLASRAALPIVPVGAAFDRPWRLRSWDRFAIPKPFSLAVCLVGPPVRVPRHLDRQSLERYRRRVEDLMNALTARAQTWAEGTSPRTEPNPPTQPGAELYNGPHIRFHPSNSRRQMARR